MLVKPSLIIPDITQIDQSVLKNWGVQGVIFDLDNTILAPHSSDVDMRIAEWLNKIQADGFQCLVLSNNKNKEYCLQAEKLFNFPVIGHAAKPRRAKFREALTLMGLTPPEVVMVGDRPLTDIWVGQRMGAYTILVDPLMKDYEAWYIQGLRRLERYLVAKNL